ncbi:MAG: DUF5916 domain-containing protein [Candidatus Cyclobacteriaceae bacterium M2_1C_046]
MLAQINAEKFTYQVNATTEEIIIDGRLEEPLWTRLDHINQFYLNFPIDSVKAEYQTQVLVAYDDKNFYIAGRAFDANPDHVVQSLKRDFDFGGNDNISFYIDPYNDYTNGFTFGITPLGVQREGIVTNGQEVSTDWDNKWFADTEHHEGFWTFEISIPFKTLRYNEELKAWNFNVLRNNLKDNTRSSWTIIPVGYRPSSFAFAGKLLFDKKLPKPGINAVLIPYVAGSYISAEETETGFNAGFDAKIGLTPSLNLDLTFNPDFSQVEVDRQVTNLSRFEIFFPERRQFFLENQDLFSEGGFRSSRPFFSRRIGISTDTIGITKQVPLQYGMRLSGKVANNWRIGLLNIQTEEEDNALLPGAVAEPYAFRLPGQNYTVAVAQRQIFGRSNIGAVFVNREALDFDEQDTLLSTTKYNRVFGLDYNLLSKDNKWEGDFFYHRSVDPEPKESSYSTGAFLRYDNSIISIAVLAESVGENYNAEVGFVQRKDIIKTGSFIDYNFYPVSRTVQNHGPGFNIFYTTDTDGNRTDMEISADYSIEFLNTAEIRAGFERRFEMLRRPFDPTRASEVKLDIGDAFWWNRYTISAETDRRKTLNAEGEVSYGGFYNGNRFVANTEINYRYQPYGQLSLAAEYNQLDFPDPFIDTEFWLIGPKVEVTFTKSIFLTTFVQYNEQRDNVNLNARLQWRYKPVSDLFVVYTENYLPSGLFADGSLNRALVFKLTYWLNL